MEASAASIKPDSQIIKNIKAVVFDWDGTVVNTMPLKFKNLGDIFAENFGIEAQKATESYRLYSGIARRDLFNRIAQDVIGREISDLEFQKLSTAFTKRNIDSYKAGQVLKKDSKATLAWLQEKGFKLFVSSSAVDFEIKELADHLGLTSYFEAIFGSQKAFKKGKPHFDFIKSKYGIGPHEILFVGDEKADMRLAGRLGVLCAGVTAEKDKSELEVEFADFILPEIDHIKEIFSIA